MVAALHLKRNRPYRHILMVILLLSWISLTISATCTMPLVMATPDPMPGCVDTDSAVHSHHQDHDHTTMQDCSFKPCLSSSTDTFSDFNRLQPELPVFILYLVWTFWTVFLYHPLTPILFNEDPPVGRRVQLIYRFCKLLN
jgi:hypothetical protein